MKLVISLFFSVIIFQNLCGQDRYGLAGEYRELPASNNFFYGSKLTLNCDYTFFRNDSAYLKDSAIIVYGKWSINKGIELTMVIDSVLAWGQTTYSKKKLEYIIINNKIYNKSITKKDFNFFTKAKGKKRQSEKFDEFQKRELSRYFDSIHKFECPQS